jgi:methionine-rich copper-binding protein CopC
VRVLLIALIALLAVPASVAAHAGFVSSSPSGDTVLETAPKEIVLRFNQAVEPDSLRLFDGVAKAVPIGKVTQPQPNEVRAPIDADLARGSYTIVWRVISDDVDPVDGFVVFHVGVKRAEEAAGGAGGSGGGGGGASTIAQGAALLLAVALAGVVVFAIARRRRLIVPVVALAGGLAVSTGLAIALDGGDSGEGAAARAFRADVQMGDLAAKVAVAPAGIGANRIELALPEPTGAEGGYFEVRVRASLPDAGIGPFVFTGIQGDDPAQFAVRQAYLPLPGRWKLEVTARRGLKGRYTGSVTLPVGSAR